MLKYQSDRQIAEAILLVETDYQDVTSDIPVFTTDHEHLCEKGNLFS